MGFRLKKISFASLGLEHEPEPITHARSWQVYSHCADDDPENCKLFSELESLSDKRDFRAAMVAIKKLVQVAALGQPLQAHYDEKQCHELHRFQYQGKERVVWRIRAGAVRLPFYYGSGKLIFLTGLLVKRKDRLSGSEKSSLESEIKSYIDAEAAGNLHKV